MSANEDFHYEVRPEGWAYCHTAVREDGAVVEHLSPFRVLSAWEREFVKWLMLRHWGPDEEGE